MLLTLLMLLVRMLTLPETSTMDLSFRERLAALETRFRKFSVTGNDRVRPVGSLKAGFAVNIDDEQGIFVSKPTPAPCPTPVIVNFDGVIFDCGCTPFFEGGSGSFMVTNEGDVNSFPTTLGLATHSSHPCGDCLDDSGHKMFWQQPPFSPSLYPHFISSYWNEEVDCSGLPTGTDAAEYVGISMVLLSGTYYLIAWSVSTNLMFYGTTTDLSLPIANTLVCDPTFHDYSDDPAMNCIFGAPAGTWNVFAHGGTATIT